jgi:riboflavin kinase/FMN adenylyltransferase
MRVIGPDAALPPGTRTVVSVGNFDGIHRGHSVLIGHTIERARSRGLASAVVTFVPHTRTVLKPEEPQPVLTTCEEKAHLLRCGGLDYLVCLRFDRSMAGHSPGEFVERILVDRLGVKEWVQGEDHAFGRDRRGTKEFLHRRHSKYDIRIFPVSLLADGSAAVSSTRIREEILGRRMRSAVEMLGHPYLVLATKVAGAGIATRWGIPTLNFRQSSPTKLTPPPGVYTAELEFHGKRWRGALYFGNCPTFKGREYHFEFHALEAGTGFPENDDVAALWIHDFVREDTAFDRSDDLAKQIERDVKNIRSFFSQE